MNKRVTLQYSTESGQNYLYDDGSGIIFIWKEVYEDILNLYLESDLEGIKNQLKDKYTYAEIDEAYQFLNHWITRYHAFFRETDSVHFNELERRDIVMDTVLSVNNTCLISLTDQCNLKCKYCIYSDEYSLTKTKSLKTMKLETADQAVRFYLDFIKEELERVPTKIFNISFYGGEPLLNFSVLIYIIDQFNQAHPGRFQYNITTNALRLNLETFQELMKREVTILVSLDGEKGEHDRLRIDLNNQGSFSKIQKNLLIIRENYPEYYMTKMGLAAVYDYKTDIIKNEEFFRNSERNKLFPPVKLVNGVSDNNTTYFQQFTEEDLSKHLSDKKKLEQKYISNILENKDNSTYLTGIFAMDYMMIVLRKRTFDLMQTDIPYGGTCFPGQKLFIDTDGKLSICERVNGTHSFGSVEAGIDEGSLSKIILEYKKEILSHCAGCSISKICPNCFTTFETKNSFKYNSQKCKNSISYLKNNLKKYSELLERCPNTKLVSNLENIFKDEFVNL